MATLQTLDANVLDAEAINWRLIVYPLAGLLVVLGSGLGIYYYQQNQRDQHESDARAAILQAKTPEALVQVADHFPGSAQADLALISAADLSFAKKDFTAAAQEYRRVIDRADSLLHDAAQVGLGSVLEASQKPDDALQSYLAVARLGGKSPYAPYAYDAAARLYGQKHDVDDERKILTEAASVGGDSPFTKQASSRLKMLNSAQNPSSPPPAVPAPQTPHSAP